MGKSGPNYRFIYVYPGKTNVWLNTIVYLYLLVYSLLYSSTDNLDPLDLINNIIYSLALDNLILKSAGSRSNLFLFLSF